MKAVILSVGEELLLGEIVDTNSAFIAEQLSDLGLEVVGMATVGDRRADLREAFADAAARAGTGGLVVVTGGLGPTEDDLTRETLAELAGRALVFCPEILEALARRFGKPAGEIAASNRRQAMVPEGARVIPNANGTAPGLDLDWQGARFCLLPGVPREMRPMLEEYVLPAARARLAASGAPVVRVRRLHLTGLGESAVGDQINHLMREGGAVRVGTRAGSGIITVRIIARAHDAAEAERLVAATEAEVRARLGEYVYGADEASPAAGCVRLLLEHKLTLALAESCTGGLLSGALTAIPGVSASFLLGAVTYANAAKTKLLGVPEELLAREGAVSEAVARAMAESVRKLAGADLALAVTGVAGPGGGTPEKPVGTVCFAAASARGTTSETRRFPAASREAVRERSVNTALALLRRTILEQVARKPGGAG